MGWGCGGGGATEEVASLSSHLELMFINCLWMRGARGGELQEAGILNWLSHSEVRVDFISAALR